jgi:predicted hydrocarbon binding protein
MYAALIQPEWRTLDVVLHTEETVHRVVRMRNPGAAPPYLRAERTSPDEVVVHYTSQRKLCAIAKGIVRGLSSHFGDGVTILETECMHRGAAECRIVVRRPAPA